MAGSPSPEARQAAQSTTRGHEQEEKEEIPDQTPGSSHSSEGELNTPESMEQAPKTSQAGDSPPPLPTGETPPPLPDEAPPEQDPEDDGWEPIWDETVQAYYFYNRKTQKTQWENPRVPDTVPAVEPQQQRLHGGYDPAIHGSYDPNASYAVEAREEDEKVATTTAGSAAQPDYSAAGHFNRFTGKWQSENLRSENYSHEAKSVRQMSAFFDVDAAANNHNGRSLRAERANKKHTRQELKAFKERRKEKKEEKRRAWLKD